MARTTIKSFETGPLLWQNTLSAGRRAKRIALLLVVVPLGLIAAVLVGAIVGHWLTGLVALVLFIVLVATLSWKGPVALGEQGVVARIGNKLVFEPWSDVTLVERNAASGWGPPVGRPMPERVLGALGGMRGTARVKAILFGPRIFFVMIDDRCPDVDRCLQVIRERLSSS